MNPPSRVAIRARLSEAETGAVIWNDEIQVDAERVRSIQHEIAGRIANTLGIHLVVSEARRLRDASTPPDAAALMMQAKCAGGLFTWTRSSYFRAAALVEEALKLDPLNPEALTWRGIALVTECDSWPGPNMERYLAEAEISLTTAVSLDSFDPYTIEFLSRLRHLQYRNEAAVAGAEAALELNPSSNRCHIWRGALHLFDGNCDAARISVERGLALSPRDPHRWAGYLFMGMAHLLSGDHGAAIGWLEKSLSVLPGYWVSVAWLGAAYAELGRLGPARDVLATLQPDIANHRQWSRTPDNPRWLSLMREHYFGALIKSGLSSNERAQEWMDHVQRTAARVRAGQPTSSQ